jgi:hypothetical protein
MEEGHFCPHPPGHPYYLSSPLSNSLSEVLTTLNAGVTAIRVNPVVRNELLAGMLEYFRIHIPAFSTLKSVRVLSDVLND